MAEEQKEPQQVTTKEPQQVTTKEPQQVTTKEPQQVTTKNPKKVEVGKRLAANNHRKREEKKAQSEAQVQSGVSQYYGIGAVLAVGGDRWSWLLHLPSQERSHKQRSTK